MPWTLCLGLDLAALGKSCEVESVQHMISQKKGTVEAHGR